MLPRGRFSSAASCLALLATGFAFDAGQVRADDGAASEYVRLALAHQAYGKDEVSRHLLEAALVESPEYAPAHWHLGHVHVDGQWVPAAQAQERAADSERLATYQKLREGALDDPRREMSLARWCRRQGWPDHEALHYTRVALNQAAHPRLRAEAAQKVDLVRTDGDVLSEEDLEYRQAESKDVQAAMKKWRGRVVAWQEAISGDSSKRAAAAADEMARVDDPAVIPVLASFLPEAGPGFGQHVVALLGSFPQQDATEALVGFALQSPSEDVRENAIAELKRRPLHDFVPILLDQFIAPVHSQFAVRWTGQGFIRYQHLLVRRNADANYVAAFDHIVLPFVSPGTRIGLNNWWRSMDGVASFFQSNNRFLASLSQIRRRLLVRERQLAQQRTATVSNNDLVVKALEETTGEVIGHEPAQWQSWWERYNETETEKPTYYAYYPTASTYTVTVDPTIRAGSCFAAGTPVWTETGLAPIESVQVGDRVLAQDLDSGELAYKVVLRTTALPPSSDTVRVAVDAESIDMTKAHVVWVAGKGWRMAKELAPGEYLSGVSGPRKVYRVDELPPELEVYNLVVADYNTFFVGESGMLVHDITYVTRRRPTTAIVPGFTPGGTHADAKSQSTRSVSLVRQIHSGLRP